MEDNKDTLYEYISSKQLEEDYNKIIKALGDKANEILFVIHMKHKEEFMIDLKKVKEQYVKEQQFKLLHEILNVPIGSPYNFPKERNMVLDNLMKAHAKLREELQVKP
jgi:hypothetical protein